MPFQVSPGVNVSEIDLTTVIPAVATTEGAIAGRFNWGPVLDRVLISSEDQLASQFQKPDSNNFRQFFTAANFLQYGNKLFVVRVENGANNASASGVGRYVKNEDDYDNNYSSGVSGAGAWIGRFPGAKGNSLKVSVCQSTNAFSSDFTSANLIFQAGNTSVGVKGANTAATGTGSFALIDNMGTIDDINVSSVITAGDRLKVATSTINFNLSVKSVSANLITLDTAPTQDELGTTSNSTVVSILSTASKANRVERQWEYHNEFDEAPGTSLTANTKSGSGDELHVVVADEDGEWTGVQGQVLERFSAVSRATDAKNESGESIYYPDVIKRTSQYILWAAHEAELSGAGGVSSTSYTNTSDKPQTVSLAGGSDGTTPTNAQIINGYKQFESAEDVDVSLILGADANQTTALYIINNIAEKRKDCIAIFSPESADVVNNDAFVGAEVEDIINFRNGLPSTSYAILDSGYKYMYDKFNDVFRYVPLNGDVGGLIVRSADIRDPWYSPAGFNRGQIKGVVKLPYNPRKAERDLLYKKGINPVVTFPGEGTILFGDKTLLSKPSAFDRINVRRLFIVLEKAISTAAKFTLFEFNDDFTRSQFRNLVEPFLRDVQGRRGIFDFRVVCDETNNTPEVIDRNEFIGDIFIKPARSINFIQLNFVAVRTGVDFEEVVGQF